MNKRIKPFLISALVALAAVLALSQLQPLVLRSVGAVDGSFGLRPVSHRCLGLTLRSEKNLSPLPQGDLEFHFGWFHFRYSIRPEDRTGERSICVGQDVWFGE
jgi:hypothetical protein